MQGGKRRCAVGRIGSLVHRASHGYLRIVPLQWLQLQVQTLFYLHDKCPWHPFIHCDLIRAGRSGERIPVEARFSAPVQTCPGAHPASYTMGTGSVSGIKRSGNRFDHPPLLSAEVEERIEHYLFFSRDFMASSRANFTFLFLPIHSL